MRSAVARSNRGTAMSPERLFQCPCHPFEVWLDATEVAHADRVGKLRLQHALRDQRRDRGGRNELESHQFGARGELAMARILERKWPGRIDTFQRLPDLDPDIEVRATHHSTGLKMRDGDLLKTSRFVLVEYRDVLQTWRFAGWITGLEAATMNLPLEARRADLAPAYWVPGTRLHPPETFDAHRAADLGWTA
jgi:hypothetical protein